jgi:hypothetical protein
MNAREQLTQAAEWLGFQHEDLSDRLRNAFDGLRLYDFMKAHPRLSDMADQWEASDLIEAIGYNPADEEPACAEDSGCTEAACVLKRARVLLDSVAFVKSEGDTAPVLRAINAVLRA